MGGKPSQPRFLLVLAAIFLGLGQALRRLRLRIADGFSQHFTQLSLCPRWFPHEGFLPLSHAQYVGMPERELNPRWDCNQRAGIAG